MHLKPNVGSASSLINFLHTSFLNLVQCPAACPPISLKLLLWDLVLGTCKLISWPAGRAWNSKQSEFIEFLDRDHNQFVVFGL